MNKRDYKGKEIFLGIDVHKKTYSVAALCEGVIIKRWTLSASPKNLLCQLKKYFPEATIYSGYEAGFSGFGLHRYLTANGINNIVIHAASIEIGARDRVKTDRRDAMKIAVQLSAQRLKSIHIPSEEMEDSRELTRIRATLVQDRNRIATRLKSKANYYGLIGPEDKQRVCLSWIEGLLKKKMGKGLRMSIQLLVNQWHFLCEQIKEVNVLLKEQALLDSKHESVYRSVPGIGPIAARTLANELGDMSQFRSERSLASYTGLTPCEYSSGGHIRRGHITRQGKPILRSILIQCSWVAIRYDKVLLEVYQRISKRAGGKRAIIAVARRLIGKIRACFYKGCKYAFIPLELKKAA